MKNRVVSMRELSRICGVSATTISKALRGHPSISRSQTERIVEIAKKFRYRPNRLVNGVMRGSTRTIGMIQGLGTTGGPNTLITGAIDSAQERGYCVFLLNSRKDVATEAKCIDLAIQHRVDGLLISTSNYTANEEFFNELRQNNIPFLFTNAFAEEVHAPHLHVDVRKIGYELTKHLIDLGHKRIGHIGEPALSEGVSPRYEGFRDALLESGHRLHARSVIASRYDMDQAYHDVLPLLRENPDRITALYCANDLIAWGAIKAARELKIRVPQDISVVGVGNLSSIFVENNIRLTTYESPHYECGERAANRLIDRIEKKISDTQWEKQSRILIPGTLIKGDTSAPPPAKKSR